MGSGEVSSMHERIGVYLKTESPSVEVIESTKWAVLEIIKAPCGDKVKRAALDVFGKIYPKISDVTISGCSIDQRDKAEVRE